MQAFIPLQPRLALLASLIPAADTLADVGTDHGYLPVRALQEGRIRRAIATDIHDKPLQHARETARQYAVAERIDFRRGDGLAVLSAHEAEAVVIAGMGGETIAAILEAAPWTRTDTLLLLQPMTKAPLLRRWLSEHGYCIQRERLAEDKGILYPVMAVRGGEPSSLSAADAVAGTHLVDDPLWPAYLAREIKKSRRRAAGLRLAEKPMQEAIEAEEALCRELEKRREQIHADRS